MNLNSNVKKSQIWVDKYRPQTFNDIIGQKEFVSRIKAFVKSKNMPHLLFAGTPGTGKTTTALVIAKELYGADKLQGNFLELNASDERGIDVIRNQIKEFAKMQSLAQVPYKIICLDEADSLTKEAQQALRRTMERYSATCRFILACNELSKIIDPIQSRCVIFKFKGLKDEDLKELIQKIVQLEELTIDEDAIQRLLDISRGDVRKLENTMQAASVLDKHLNLKTINEVTNAIEIKELDEMINYTLQGEFKKARDLMIKLKSVYGLSALEILKEIYSTVINLEIDEKKIIKLVDKIGTVEFRIVEGSDEELQLEVLLAMFSSINLNLK
ncbi:MAG: replication factor C small subunit [Candidatus Woesearchaeota archaeon]